MTAARVGIAGTGRMGAAAAQRLAELGVPVVLANRTSGRAADLAAQLGCGYAESFGELAAQVDVVLVMVSGEEGVQEALAGPGGILTGGGDRAQTVVIMSTVRPQLVTDISGVTVLDAPLVGRPAELVSGDVTVLVGGSPADLQAVDGILSSLGHVVHVGPVGAGAAMKLAMNTVIFGLVAAVSECMALATASGALASVAYDVLTGSALNSRFLELRRPYFVGAEDLPVQFSMESARETLELIDSAASSVGVSLPMTRANLATLAAAVAGGHAALDVTALQAVLAPPASPR